MNDNLPISKLDQILAQKQELQKRIEGGKGSKALYRELYNLEKKIELITKIKDLEIQIEGNKEFINKECDEELKKIAVDELQGIEKEIQQLKHDLDQLILSESMAYHESLLMELRAGTGGDEASIFAMDLMNMYIKFAQINKIKTEVIELIENGAHGIKYTLLQFKSDRNTYELFQFEAGVHRVQRIPVTEANGRIHTSTATVAILPEPEQNEEIMIHTKDLKIDTYRASGAGGQHVNKTESAVRITHLPTNIVVQCQTEKSQIQNREQCMKVLKAKLFERALNEQKSKIDETRRQHIGSGDRSEKYRTYNYPQNRITDHRFNITLYNLDITMETGNINPLIEKSLIAYKKALCEKVLDI